MGSLKNCDEPRKHPLGSFRGTFCTNYREVMKASRNFTLILLISHDTSEYATPKGKSDNYLVFSSVSSIICTPFSKIRSQLVILES